MNFKQLDSWWGTLNLRESLLSAPKNRCECDKDLKKITKEHLFNCEHLKAAFEKAKITQNTRTNFSAFGEKLTELDFSIIDENDLD